MKLMCWKYGRRKVAKRVKLTLEVDCGMQRELDWMKKVCLMEYGK